MWLFTRFGFFSVVCNVHDDKQLIVRGRSLDDMRSLIDRYGDTLRRVHADIKTTPDADYRYRLFVQKPNWASVAAQIVGDIDYNNFKDEVHKVSHERAEAYMDVWSTMYGVQRSEENKKRPITLNRGFSGGYSLFNETETNTSQEK